MWRKTPSQSTCATFLDKEYPIPVNDHITFSPTKCLALLSRWVFEPSRFGGICFLVPWREISLLKNFFSKQSEGFCVWICFPRLVTSVTTVGLSQNHKSPQIPQEMVRRREWSKFTPCKVRMIHSMKWNPYLHQPEDLFGAFNSINFCFTVGFQDKNLQVFGHPFLLLIIDHWSWTNQPTLTQTSHSPLRNLIICKRCFYISYLQNIYSDLVVCLAFILRPF